MTGTLLNNHNSFVSCTESPKRFARMNGTHQSLVLALSSSPLSIDAKAALDKSFLKLGWGTIASFTLSPEKNLSPQDLLHIIEGIDPAVLLLCDATVCLFVQGSYRQDIPYERAVRLNCRECCAFESLDFLLTTSSGKQRVWLALKSLPQPNGKTL